jgi:hypothetical protein
MSTAVAEETKQIESVEQLKKFTKACGHGGF